MIERPPAADDTQSADDLPGPTPIWISRRLRIAFIVVAVLLLVLAVRLAPGILIVALGGVALALILSYPVGWFARAMPRWLAILSVMLLLLGGATLALLVLVPFLIDQLTSLVADWPGIMDDLEGVLDRLAQVLRDWGLLPQTGSTLSDQFRAGLRGRSQGIAQTLLADSLNLASGAVDFVIELFGIFFIAIYLLADVHKIRSAILAGTPDRYRADIDGLWDAFSVSISRYLAGVIVVATVQGGLATLALWLLGVPYALLLGAWVAVASLIPFFGAYLGAVPSVLVALTVSPTTAAVTLVLYVVLRELESELLTPRIQGKVVHMHPAIILLTVIWAGQALGLLGFVLAVPTLVVISVLLTFFRVRLRVRPAAGNQDQDDPNGSGGLPGTERARTLT